MAIFNIVAVIVIIAASTLLFIMLLNAYKRIEKLESERSHFETRAKRNERELLRRAGEDENSNGHTFEERK